MGQACCSHSGQNEVKQELSASAEDFQQEGPDDRVVVKMSDARAAAPPEMILGGSRESAREKLVEEKQKEVKQQMAELNEDVVDQADADPELANLELGNLTLSDTPARDRESTGRVSSSLLASFNAAPGRMRD
mmetsp:Transcript_69889/g.158611  ORF Transcript_69889/g.158611 Transcript_69889/m.158611 type:complete len:133 (-) Transcript_69889:285-683(-)